MRFNRPVTFNQDFLEQMKQMLASQTIDASALDTSTAQSQTPSLPEKPNRKLKASAANQLLAE
jgi:hypothetical protein